MNQQPLFNYTTLATTRAIKSAQRARTLASTLSKSVKIAENKSLVPSADSKPLQHKGYRSYSLENDDAPEFHLPDEDRIIRQLFISGDQCRHCGESALLVRHREKGLGMYYQVGCPWRYSKGKYKLPQKPSPLCPEPTPWMKSSAGAIRIWTITQKCVA